MDNKNEKTFADLFSSSTSETNSTGITFDNLKTTSDKRESKEEKNGITFDNLFEKTEPTELKDISEKNNTGINSIFEKSNQHEINSSISKMSAEQVTSPQEKIIEEDIKLTSLFEHPRLKEENQEEKESFDKQETQITSQLEYTKPPQEINSNVQNEEEISKSSNQDIPFLKEEVESKLELLSEQSTKPSIIEPTIQEKISLEKNPFLEDTSQEEKKENLSIDKNIQLEQKNLFNKSTKEISQENFENNPFFNEINSSDQENNENPFFDNKIDSTKQNNISENTTENTTKKEENDLWNKKEQEIKTEEPKSISPFFQEDMSKIEEDSPFFPKKINLIETKSKEKKINNIDTSKSKHFNVKIVKKKEPLPKFILGVLSYAIFIWLLLIGITLLVYVLDIKIRAAKGDYSSPTFNAYVVLTGSMLPDIQVYDVVITKKVDASTLKEGDIITFASADSRFLGTIITHRIIKKNYDAETKEYTFQTQGDNNNVADSALVPQSNIYGKVILKIPKLGYLQEFLTTEGGWIIVILIPCLTVISYDIVKLAKGLKKKKYQNITVKK